MLPARIAERLAAAPAAGMSLFRFLNVRSPGQVLELTSAFQRAGAASPHAAPADSPGSSPGSSRGFLADARRGRPGGRPVPGARGGAHGLRRQHGPGCRRRRGPDRAGRPGDRHGSAGDGRERGLRPGPGSGDEPGQPGVGDPCLRGFAGGRRAARGGDGSRAAGGRGGRHGQARPGDGAHLERYAPRAGGGRGGTRRAGRPRVRAVPGRLRGRCPARDVGARRGAGRDWPRRPSGDAVARRDDRPAATRPRLRGRHDLRRARHGGARPGSRPRCSTSSPRSARAWTCCSRRRTRWRWHASRTRWSARSRSGCWIRPRWPPRNVVWPRSGRGSGSAGPAPDLAVVGSAEHLALAAELAARSITLVRDPGGVLPLLGRRRVSGSDRGPLLAVMPRPADLTPADTSSDGCARTRRRPAPPLRDGRRGRRRPGTRPRLDRRSARPRRRGIGRRRRHDRWPPPARPARPGRGDRRDRHAGRRGRAARAVGRRRVPARRHRPRDLLDPARLPRCPRGRARRRGRGAAAASRWPCTIVRSGLMRPGRDSARWQDFHRETAMAAPSAQTRRDSHGGPDDARSPGSGSNRAAERSVTPPRVRPHQAGLSPDDRRSDLAESCRGQRRNAGRPGRARAASPSDTIRP